jgi:hypothetical protein
VVLEAGAQHRHRLGGLPVRLEQLGETQKDPRRGVLAQLVAQALVAVVHGVAIMTKKKNGRAST